VGAAVCGMKPIVDIMFQDFLTLAMDQLVNHAAKFYYMYGNQASVPLVVRTLRREEGATMGDAFAVTQRGSSMSLASKWWRPLSLPMRKVC
jgi:pyruvate/2-oxoglutarate/acetoin dehydrogenase E1 component